LIRRGSRRDFTIAANAETNAAAVKTVVGIDLFARRCIEGVQLTMTARAVTQPPHLAQRQPPKWAGFGAFVAVWSATVQKGFSAMIFRILAASAWPRGRVLALLAATALTTTCLVPDAKAQTPAPAPGAPAATPKAPPKAAPKAVPKAAPAPAPAPAAQAPAAPAAGAPAGQSNDQVQLIYAPWTKFCLKGQDAGAKQVCFTGKDGRIESGQPVIAAVIIEPEGEPKKILRVTLPLGMQLVHGTRVIVDSNAPQQAPYVICFQNGCMSDYDVTPELIANLKKGQNLVVQAINSNGAPLTLPLPLAEFAKAYDGPPTDPKVFEETQKKLQEELQKRAAEARAKLEANQPAGAAANPAAK
jgi:invasion protein IalB